MSEPKERLARAQIFGAVLAGGASSRMGAAKALLRLGAESVTLLERAARTLDALAARVEVAAGGQPEVVAATRRPAFEDACAAGDAAEDKRSAAGGSASGAGPLGALAASLDRSCHFGHSVALVLPCDMPLVTAAELEPLLAAVAEGADAAFYRVDGRDQPLCAAFRSTCGPAAHAALARGQRRVVALFAETGTDGRALRVTRLDPSEKSAVRLMNVNAPADYDRVRAMDPV